MYKKLLNAVTNFGEPTILLVGDFLLDSYVYGDALRISPEAPVQVLNVVDRKHNCGGAGSVAADLTAFGAKPVCIGVIGQDPNGRELEKLLDDVGADLSGIIKTPDRPTISKQRVIGLAQHRHPQQLLRIDDERTDPLTNEQYKKILQTFKEKLPQADIVCLQDYNKGLLSTELCKQLIALAKKAGKKILIDPSVSGDYSRYTGACLITPNRREASIAVRFEIKTLDDAAKAAKILREKLNLEAVVITLDKQGAYLHTDKISEHVPTIAKSVYDVTGAGDMVLAALAVSLAAGNDYKTAVQLANIAGGIEVKKFGVATVSIDELLNEIITTHRTETGKICGLILLGDELEIHRRQKKSIVFTNGCFDVIHRGHIEFLRFCKDQGDIVVLALNSDNSVKKIKGPKRPINNQHDRAEVLAEFETIDYIVIFDEPDPLNTIKALKPDVLVKGVDWAEKGVIGREFVESYGGKVVLAPLVDGKSSTNTINKMNALKEE